MSSGCSSCGPIMLEAKDGPLAGKQPMPFRRQVNLPHPTNKNLFFEYSLDDDGRWKHTKNWVRSDVDGNVFTEPSGQIEYPCKYCTKPVTFKEIWHSECPPQE